MSRFTKIILVIYLLFLIGFTWNPIYPEQMILQHIPTAIVFFILGGLSYQGYSDRSIFHLAIFMLFHIVAARWIYSYVPYDYWIESLFGFKLSDCMGWERNHFDRLIHFLYGLLFTWPFVEFLMKRKFQFPSSLWISLLFIFGSSAVYEIFEWALTFTLSPDNVENYNGQQGDVWDAQKDMALAGLGSMISLIVLRIFPPKPTNSLVAL